MHGGGMDAPIPMFAAQIQQESAWNPNAKSPYAEGLTQFTPSTAKWIGQIYPDALGNVDVYSPSWAMRAMVIYDVHLFDRIKSDPVCDRWAMALSSYNGGLGNLRKDQRLTERMGGDKSKWWGEVEKYTNRAAWARKENRDYPRRILLEKQLQYIGWGRLVCRDMLM
jgi:membrane-bound lytic murein transglycosylase MltF